MTNSLVSFQLQFTLHSIKLQIATHY
jgi:hypothetical protein